MTTSKLDFGPEMVGARVQAWDNRRGVAHALWGELVEYRYSPSGCGWMVLIEPGKMLLPYDNITILSTMIRPPKPEPSIGDVVVGISKVSVNPNCGSLVLGELVELPTDGTGSGLYVVRCPDGEKFTCNGVAFPYEYVGALATRLADGGWGCGND